MDYEEMILRIEIVRSVRDSVISLITIGGKITMEIIIKLDRDEPVKVKTSSIYGEQHPLPDWDPEILRNEIQDLKLENDRLMQQNKLMIDYIHALACVESKKSKFYALCGDNNCPYYDYDKGFGKGDCKLGSKELIEKEAANIIDKLEAL